tara:strand:+ start:2912 stop:3850 length:939 start_codon:yes stop_codon:yes gene_type:complete
MFAAEGLRVNLHREPGWATIRDKIIFGEIDAAHSIAGLAISMAYGVAAPRQSCVTGFLFNTHGNAITLSSALVDAGVHDAASLVRFAETNRRNKPVVLAVVHSFSTHHFLIHAWLRSVAATTEKPVRLIVLPPPLVVRNLELGHIDGFCAGEPYNSLAEEKGIGKIVAWSQTLAPFHPEKALIVRTEFAEKRAEQHLALIRVLDKACAFCDDPVNRGTICELLSSPKYLGIPRSSLEYCLSPDRDPKGLNHIYHQPNVNCPSLDKAEWLINEMVQAGLVKPEHLAGGPKPADIFREDIYKEALDLDSVAAVS